MSDGAADTLAGRYRLLGPLERSPALELWNATDTVLARDVVVALLGPQAGRDPAARRRFEATASAAARLAHPALVAVFDTGTDGDRPFVVCEHARGTTGRTLLEGRGPLPPNRVAVIGRQLAAALTAAHAAGLVHGTLDLQSVVVTDDDRVKVDGFGTARGGQPEDDVTGAARILYQLLTGTPPADPPLSARRLRAGVPPSLDDAIIQALPGGPVTTAQELHARLAAIDATGDDAVVLTPSEPTPPAGVRALSRLPGWRRGRWRGGALAGAFIIVVSMAVALAVTGGHSPRPAPPAGATPGASGSSFAIVTATAFDPPPGDGQEDNGRLPLVHDGNPATVWSTEEYTNPHFGNLKDGVGLYVTLDATHTVHAVVVTTPTLGWSAEVFVAATPAPSLAGWGTAAARFTASASPMTITLHGTRGRFVLVWITDLGPAARVDIGELAVR
jgi:hypothetical protein